MKGKFDPYVLWPLGKNVQIWIVDRSTARDFTVPMLMSLSILYIGLHAAYSSEDLLYKNTSSNPITSEIILYDDK